MSVPGTPENGEAVLATGTLPIAIYFDRQEQAKQSDRCLFDDRSLHCNRFPWRSDNGPQADVVDDSENVVFRKFRRHGPHERGEPIVFKLYDLESGQWAKSGTFVSNAYSDGVEHLSLTSLEPAHERGNQREMLNLRILDDCNFSRLVQYVVASKRDHLSRFGTVIVATDSRLSRFREDLRYWKIDADDRGRGFDYVPKIASSIP
jgi:hypothetical protein